MKNQASETTERPDWAPDDCPPGVIRLIDDEQYLETLGVRGLASADAAELHQACDQLRRQLNTAFQAGQKTRRQIVDLSYYLVPAILVGLVSGVLLMAYLGGS
jgi:hypothetical protein